MGNYNGYELETIINYNRIESEANLYTADVFVIKKMDALVEKYPDTFKCIKDNGYSKEYVFPKKLVSIRSPRPKMTEEQRQAAIARLNKNKT